VSSRAIVVARSGKPSTRAKPAHTAKMPDCAAAATR